MTKQVELRLHDEGQKLLEKVDRLEELYYQLYQLEGEYKTLQGVERCIALRMKLLGFDGKEGAALEFVRENRVELDLSKLSIEALREIKKLIDEQKEKRREMEG